MTVKLTDDARSALIAAGTSRQGVKVVATWPVHQELVAAGLIGNGGGLTMRGTIARERAVDAVMAAFTD